VLDSAGIGGFCLREYSALVMQEDGSERDEIVNEAKNLLVFMNPAKPPGKLQLTPFKFIPIFDSLQFLVRVFE